MLLEPESKINCVGLQGDGITYEIHFVVAVSHDIAPARTEVLAHVHRHLRHAGISLAITGIAPPPSSPAPTVIELMAGSDLFGPLEVEERTLLAEHLVAVTHEAGDTLIREGDMPDKLFLLAAGTIELAQGEGAGKRVLLRASPGDSVGMISLITGMPSLATATALTSVAAYTLDRAAIAAALLERPELAASLEVQAKRGQAWLRCEAAAHEDDQIEKPDMLASRLRQFLRRLNV